MYNSRKKSASDKIIQFRQSGVRVKRNHRFPTLTTASAQVPYVPKLKRRLSCDEMGRLQSMGRLKYKPLLSLCPILSRVLSLK